MVTSSAAHLVIMSEHCLAHRPWTVLSVRLALLLLLAVRLGLALAIAIAWPKPKCLSKSQVIAIVTILQRLAKPQ